MFVFLVDVSMSLAASFIYLGAGLSVGLAGLAAGFAIGIVGDAGVRGTAQQPRLYVGMVCIAPLILFYSCRISSHYADSAFVFFAVDFDFDFRRGAGSLWAYCCSHYEHQSQRDEGCRMSIPFLPPHYHLMMTAI